MHHHNPSLCAMCTGHKAKRRTGYNSRRTGVYQWLHYVCCHPHGDISNSTTKVTIAYFHAVVMMPFLFCSMRRHLCPLENKILFFLMGLGLTTPLHDKHCQVASPLLCSRSRPDSRAPPSSPASPAVRCGQSMTWRVIGEVRGC